MNHPAWWACPLRNPPPYIQWRQRVISDLFSAANSHENKLGILLRTAITERQVSGEHIKGRWYDIGTPARLT